MSDLYREILVKRATPAADRIKQGGLIGLTVVCLAGSLLFMPLLPAGIVLAVVTFFLFPRFDLEYEYLYVNGDIDVDKIMSKQKRKHCASYSLENLEVMAPPVPCPGFLQKQHRYPGEDLLPAAGDAFLHPGFLTGREEKSW